MRYILFILFALITTFASAQVQYLGSPTTTVRNRGNFVSDSLFYLPKRTKAPSDSGALRYQISDSALYVWTGSQWIKAGGGAGSMTGTLTTNYIPKATGSTTLGNSVMYDSSSHVRVYGNWIGSGNSNRYLFQTEVDGQNGYGLKVQQNDSNDNNLQWVMSLRHGLLTTAKPRPDFGVGHDMQLLDDAGTFRRVGSILTRLTDTTASGISAKMQFGVAKSGSLVTPLQIYSDSSIRMAKLAGSGSRYVVADANGDLTASASLASVDTFSISTRAWRQKGIDSVASVRVGGSGTTNYIPKFTASTTLGNSQIFDNGTSVGIGTTSPLTYGANNTSLEITSKTTTSTSVLYASNIDKSVVSHFYTDGNGTLGAIGTQTNHAFALTTNNTERMRITSSGQLLIGTTSWPTTLIAQSNSRSIIGNEGILILWNEASAAANNVAGLYLGAKGGGTNGSTTIAGGVIKGLAESASTNAGALTFETNGDNGNAERMRITSAGDVVVGGTSAINSSSGRGNITINGTSAILNFGISNVESGYIFHNGTNLDIAQVLSQPLRFLVGNSERMRINSSGELLLGGTTDVGAYVLQAFGGFYNSGNALLNAASGETWIGGTDYGNYQLSVSNNMYVDGQSVLAGNGAAEVLLGTTSDAGTYRLQVAGNVYSTGTITTAAPTGGTAKPFKIGAAATVSPTSPNRTIEIEIDGTTYYLHAKTTND